MPYDTLASLPDAVKKLPKHQQEIFRAAFNNAYGNTCKDREDREECAFKIAWAAAKGKVEHSESRQFRELRAKISYGNYQELDGGILVKDVKLLASGVWTDSHIGTPLFYPEKVLEKYAGNWVDNSLWSRHSGGMPRAITDKVGEIHNPRYNGGAVVGDLWLHLKTQTSRDTAELIKSGLVDYVSVEHGGKERWNAAEKRYEAEEIVFGGVAVVNRGACAVCTIHNETGTEPILHSWTEVLDTMTEKKETEGKVESVIKAELEKKETDIKILQEQLEEAKKLSVNKVSAELESARAKMAELEVQNKELVKKLAGIEHDSRVKELQRQIAELSKEPVYHTKITSGAGEITVRELELDNEEFPAFTARDFGE